jgi:hypothetical protein
MAYNSGMSDKSPRIDIRSLYDGFEAPIAAFDCGAKCAPHNPSGKPFCCDICHAVPAAYHQEWLFLQPRTNLWHEWRGDECPLELDDPEQVRAETPDHMRLLACLGPAHCQRQYRALSCRQFPFFPYVSSSLEFLGLAYEWEFENTCWVISNLAQVSQTYRQQFISTYDRLFDFWLEEFNSYIALSEDMRDYFAERRRRIPLLHRNGGYYLVSPKSERMQRVPPERLPKFGPYR